MSRTPKQHAALTELQKRYGGTEEGLLNEWARVSDFYNDHREIGAPGWGMLEVDVKRAWRKRYRVTQEDVVIKCACAVKVEIPHNKATVLVGRIVHGERRCQNLDLGATQKNPLPGVRRGEVAEWLALADVKERKLTDYIPPVLGPKMINVPCVAAGCERSWSITDDRVKVYAAKLPGGWWADKDSNYWCPDHRDNSVSYLAWIREDAADYIPPEVNVVRDGARRMCGCGAVYIPADLSQFADAKTMHRLVPHPCYMLEESGQYGFIPPEDTEHAPFAGGGVREGHGDRPRFELLVPAGVPFSEQLLTRCAVHMAKGAEKYTQYGECTCGANTVTGRPTHSTCADPATKETSDVGTRSMPSANERAPETGDLSTESASVAWTGSVPSRRASERQSTDSPRRSTPPTSPNHAGSAAVNPDTWTTTTRAASKGAESAFEAGSAIGATSDSGSTRSGSKPTSPPHSPGCPALRVIRSGERNWESFSDEAALERAKASAFRHLMQWLTDDGEEDHAAAVVFNLMAAEHVAAKLARSERKCAPEEKVCDD